MVKKHYISKNRIPDYCPLSIKPAFDKEYADENAAPPAIGVVVGYQIDGSDQIVSMIDVDSNREEGARVLDRLIYDGLLAKSHGKMVVGKKGTEQDDGREVNVTKYGLLYFDQDDPKSRPTMKSGIPGPSFGQYACDICVEMSFVDEDGQRFCRNIVIRKTTPPTFRYTFQDMSISVSNELIRMLYDGKNGFRFANPNGDDYKGRCKVLFYNMDSLASGKEIEFDSVKEMLSTIVAVRLIGVTKVPKKGCRVVQ